MGSRNCRFLSVGVLCTVEQKSVIAKQRGLTDFGGFRVGIEGVSTQSSPYWCTAVQVVATKKRYKKKSFAQNVQNSTLLKFVFKDILSLLFYAYYDRPHYASIALSILRAIIIPPTQLGCTLSQEIYAG